MVKNEWTRMPEMLEGKSGHTSCALGDAVYVFGRSHFYSVQDQVEKLTGAKSLTPAWQKLELKNEGSSLT